jgi:AraC-like DNA-binding protein
MQRMVTTALAMPPSAAGTMTRLAAARATAAGLNLDPLLRKARLTAAQIQDRHARVDVAAQIAFLNLVADALPDELLGFNLAETLELREAGLLYFVLASSATLGEAMARAERYSSITNEGILLQCHDGNDFGVRCSYVGVPRHADRHQVEFWATMLVRLCQALTETSVRPIRVSFVHPRCSVSDRLDAFFGCEVAFASDRDEVAFARAASQLPLVGAEPYLNKLLVGYCQEALSHRTSPANPLRASVENALAPLLPHGKGSVGEVARVLGMSDRTLSRRLAAENLTFLGIREEMRKDLARRYLADASLSISRIAWLLGFQEVSAFTHAFRRWAGKTPTQMRAESLDHHSHVGRMA